MLVRAKSESRIFHRYLTFLGVKGESAKETKQYEQYLERRCDDTCEQNAEVEDTMEPIEREQGDWANLPRSGFSEISKGWWRVRVDIVGVRRLCDCDN